jgi:ATP-dependent helicase/nuclease subunit A
MSGRPPADDAARNAIRDALDETLVVQAAAGTGKTTELIRRILRVIETGRAQIVAIVAVTFTEKAAGELKLRLREAIEIARESAPSSNERERLEDALRKLEEAHVNTIHGFCADLLRERPVEAGVDPLFAVLTEPQSGRLYARAFNAWLQEALQAPPEGVRRALRRSSAPMFGGGMDGGPVDRLRGAGRALADWRDFDADWRRPPFDRDGDVRRLVQQLHELATLTAAPSFERDNLFVDTDAVRRLSRQIALEQQFGHEDLDGWESRLVDLVRDRGFSRTRKGSGYKYGQDVTRTQVLAARDQLLAALQQFKREADADLAACLQRELRGATDRYQELKRAAGVLDFADLLCRARDLIRDNHAVRAHLQTKFARIFIDEFQDTDPVQAEILMLLAADTPTATNWETIRPHPGKLFIVGDPKQAIYRFRGTDVGTYWQVSEQIQRAGGRVLELTTSYRSVPEIQAFVNAAFARGMTADARALQPPYVPLSRHRDPAADSQPAIVALPVPRPYSARGPLRASGVAIESSLPDAVGAFIAWLLNEKHGWRVAERSGDGSEQRVPIQPRHIAVLFRRFVNFGKDITRGYTDAIEARNIPHLLVGGKSFHDREEVETMRAALAAIEWPDDELSVFATLKGSLFAIDDEQLLEFKDRFGAFHPFRIPKELGGNSGAELALTGTPTTHLTPIADAMRLLQRLHRSRNYRPVADTIGRLIAETRAHVGFILRPAGEQALANVLHVAELARQYEAGGGISFRGFIDELETAAESESAEAPILEESSDGVRLMTVHKAKGLEFPVVILADMTCRMSRADASRFLDARQRLCALRIGGWAPQDLHDHEPDEVLRDQAEGVRLAYVAATRARDLLVVPALGDEPWEGGWLGPVTQALYPAVEKRRTSERGAKCPAFTSKDSVLQRPNDETALPTTVCPGAHRFGDYTVVWWDPGTGGGLELGKRPRLGVRREELIVKDVPKDVIADGRTAYDRWRLARADARAMGTTPGVAFDTVRRWTTDDAVVMPAGADPSTVQIVRIATDRPARDGGSATSGGQAMGLLVHAVLAQVALDASEDDLSTVANNEARVLGLTDAHANAARAIVSRALRQDLLTRAREAQARGTCRRETPVTLQLADGTLIEGVVDLAFEENGEWTVIDYKTDRELAAAGEGRYRRQVALYGAAISAATGQHAKGIILLI